MASVIKAKIKKHENTIILKDGSCPAFLFPKIIWQIIPAKNPQYIPVHLAHKGNSFPSIDNVIF